MTRIAGSSRLTLLDWTALPPERVAPLYQQEAERWLSTLDWDTSNGWETVERGRVLGSVSGCAVADELGRIIGWSYHLVHRRTLQIGAFVAASEPAAQMMIDAILNPQRLATVEAVTFFAFSDAPGLAAALRQKGLAVDRYWYLARDLQGLAPERLADVRLWNANDLGATSHLLARAYDTSDDARPFAPGGTEAEWDEYAEQLARGTGCGTLLPEASVCVPDGPNRLQGVALVTRVSETTAHLVQLAVDPQRQSRHLGSTLLRLACAGAARAGCRQMTLLVGGRNSRARALYESSRFEMRGSFLSAGTRQPRRSTSVAPGNLVMTRR